MKVFIIKKLKINKDINMKKIFFIISFFLFGLYFYADSKTPEVFFNELLLSFRQSKIENKEIESVLDDGISLTIYDSNNNISPNLFCKINLYATMGQTQYVCYKEKAEAIWYIEKEVMIYNSPYTLEDAEIEKTYFKYEKEKTLVYNNETERYDIEKDTGEFIAIVDFNTLKELVELIEKNI